MKLNIRKKKYIIIFVIVSVVAFFVVNFCLPIFDYLLFPSYAKVVKMNWEIKLPENYEEIYETDSGSSIQGDGDRFHVFQYDKAISTKKIGLNQKLSQEKKNEILEILNGLEVPKTYYPIWKHNLSCKVLSDKDDERSIIYIIYDNNENKLYIVENIF